MRLNIVTMGLVVSMVLGRATRASTFTSTLQDGVNGYSGTRDTFISANPSEASSPQGAVTYLDVDGAILDDPVPTHDKKGLIKFDLSGLPKGLTFDSATLTLTQSRFNASDPIQVFAVAAEWDELVADWTDRLSGIPWSMEGAASPSDFAPALLGTIPSGSLGEVSVALSASLVQSWYDNPATNFGVILVSTDSTGILYRSSEYSVVAERPALTLMATVVPEPRSVALIALWIVEFLSLRKAVGRRSHSVSPSK